MSEVKEKPAVQRVPPPEKQTAKIDRWYEFGGCLIGYVYDHPRLQDGLYIQTSRVMWIDRRIKMAETRNTVYILLKESK